MTNVSDETLVEQYRKGDSAAFDELCRRYAHAVKSLSRGFFALGFDENDLIQEGLLGLLGAAMRYDPSRSGFSTFAFSCIKNKMSTFVSNSASNKHKALNDSVPLDETSLGEEPSKETSPESAFIDFENLEELLKKIFSALSDLETCVFRRYVNGESYTEIADALSLSPKSVDNALNRIKTKIKKITERE